MTHLLVRLRPDVQRTVDRVVAEAFPLIPDRGQPVPRRLWELYGRAKADVSAQCGWDAPADRYDPEQYELAVRSFVDRVGI